MVCSICKCEGHNKRKCPSINVIKDVKKPELVKKDLKSNKTRESFSELMKNLSLKTIKNQSLDRSKKLEYYEYVLDKSSKFWQIEYIPNEECEYQIKYGKIGDEGRIIVKKDTSSKINKLIESKKKKGYILKKI